MPTKPEWIITFVLDAVMILVLIVGLQTGSRIYGFVVLFLAVTTWGFGRAAKRADKDRDESEIWYPPWRSG